MSNRIHKTEEDELESVDVAYEKMQEWKFFRPSAELTKDVLRLNEKLGGAYFDGEYEALNAREGGDARASPLKDLDWFRRALGVLSHDGEGGDEGRAQYEEEEFFRASISERIFNHLAMLARSRYAAQGGAFSIREEFTAELAEKIGLGLYTHDKTARDLRAEAEGVLLRLAREFQHWLVDVKGGWFDTMWGEIHAAGGMVERADDGACYLTLTPDVEAGDESGGSE